MHFPRSVPLLRDHPPAGPRFRTDAEGNIALSRDWHGLLTGARRFPRVVLQTRNTCVRLITMDAFPALTWSPARGCARDDHGALLMHPARWRQAHATLSHCLCCGSAGKLRLFDAAGAEALQLCAHPDIEPADWADYLAPFAAPLNAVPQRPPAGVFHPGAQFVPDAGITVHNAALLPALFARVAREQTSFACTLATPSVTRSRDITPHRVTCEHGLLTVADGIHTLQIALPSIRHLAVRRRHLDLHLHLIGPDGSRLLDLHPAGIANGSCRWSALLHAVFPLV